MKSFCVSFFGKTTVAFIESHFEKLTFVGNKIYELKTVLIKLKDANM
jgi:hypothetical protein